MNSKDIGNITEAKIISKFLESGYTVAPVFGDNARYDLIIDINDELFRVQCKTGRIREGRMSFNTSSVSPFTNKQNNYIGQIDFFAVYCPDNGKYYLVPPNMFGISKGYLRITKPLRKNPRTIWAQDHEI